MTDTNSKRKRRLLLRIKDGAVIGALIVGGVTNAYLLKNPTPEKMYRRYQEFQLKRFREAANEPTPEKTPGRSPAPKERDRSRRALMDRMRDRKAKEKEPKKRQGKEKEIGD